MPVHVCAAGRIGSATQKGLPYRSAFLDYNLLAVPNDKHSPDFPTRKHLRLPLEEYSQDERWYFVTVCCRNKEARFLTLPARDAVVEALAEVAALRHIEVPAYCVLPNHIHFICSSGEAGLPAFVAQFKFRVYQKLKAFGDRESPWQKRYFDHIVRNEESLEEKCAYIWRNPVRLGLSKTEADYRWSGSFIPNV